MEQDRRTFLKTTGIAGAAALSGLAPSAAQAATSVGEPHDLPKGMTFATLRRSGGYGLGLRTERGVLDVAAAEKDFGVGAPTTITAVLRGEGDVAGLRRLVDSAKNSGSPDRYFIAEDKATFGPCVTDPEKMAHRIEFVVFEFQVVRSIALGSSGDFSGFGALILLRPSIPAQFLHGLGNFIIQNVSIPQRRIDVSVIEGLLHQLQISSLT